MNDCSQAPKILKMTHQRKPQILIVNAGGQYCHLIARRIRDAGVQAIIASPAAAAEQLGQVKGVIISGGPSSVYAEDAPKFPQSLFEGTVPLLGICYGHQVLAATLGGSVEPGKEHEYGEAMIEVTGHDTLLKGLNPRERVWMSHGDEVVAAPPGFEVLAKSPSCPIAAMADSMRRFFGVQFHPEVTDTPCGNQILRNFVFEVCRCVKDWEMSGLIDGLKKEIRDTVRDRHVLFFVSGGVDSTVAFTLCTAALGPDRVTGVFVDTGFMRLGEKDQIERAFTSRGWHNIRFIDASESFLSAVQGIADPEQKRHLIGERFLDVQRQVTSELDLGTGGWMLGQGTIYPDTIESGFSDKAAVIKTHHNRVPAIEEMIKKGLILEPLREFYKDEVRSIGRQLGLPESLVAKNPFPGPGLAVRCLCSAQRLELQTPEPLLSAAGEFGLKAWSLPLRTVGVQGDFRSYSNVVVLAGGDKLETYSSAARRITRAVRGTNRVAFLVSSQLAGDLGHAFVRDRFITRSRLDLLRQADAISHQMLEEEGLAAEVWQFPVVLLPLSLGEGETIALRPVSSADAMTARHANLPMDFIQRLGRRLEALPGVDLVLYDVTDKPPATIEWE
jgi:GMP synthase (glutamine-hydrolysing)